ncbi:hypothetical protein ACFL4A_04330 [bacterium]
MKKYLVSLLLVIGLSVSLYAAAPFQMDGAMGTVVLTDDQGNQTMYSQLSLRPQINLGKLGVGLDLFFYFDENGYLREEDWDDASKIPEKILYIKYAEKGDPFYFHIGGMKEYILGHGIIFNNYSNLILYPDLRKIALAVDVNAGYFGFETITSNIKRAEVLGGRFYYRPLHKYSFPFFRKLGVGISAGTDVNPDNNKDTENDQVTIIGFDIDLPILDMGLLSTLAFFDIATMELGSAYTDDTLTNPAKNGGVGNSVGIMGKFAFLNYRAEYRSLQNNFSYGYFNSFYEVDRSTKGYTIAGDDEPMREGPYFEAAYSFMDKAHIKASYENYDHDPENKYPWLHAEIVIKPELLLNKLSFAFYYDRRNANTWEEVKDVENEDAIMITEMGYNVGGSVMLVVIEKKTFDRFGRSFRTRTIETRFRF